MSMLTSERRPGRVAVIDEEPGTFWFGAYHNLLVLVWLRRATAESVERFARVALPRMRASAEGASLVHIITEGAELPDASARAALCELHARGDRRPGCAAVVIAQQGLEGAAMRGAIASVSLVAPKHYRIRVFDSVESAAPWLATQHERSTGARFTTDEVLTVLRSARAAAA